MPKIFGDVTLMPGQARCICRKCGFQWNSDSQEYSNLLNNKKVTCPMCRMTKEHTPGKQIELTGALSEYVIDTMLIGANLQILKNDEKYKDYAVPIKSLKCGHLFTIKSRYMNSWLKEPVCLKCNPDKLASLQYEEPEKIEKPVVSTEQAKIGQRDKVDAKRQAKEKIESDMKSLVGQEKLDSTIIDVDTLNAEVIIHCNNCGKERHIAYVTYVKDPKDSIICPSCSSSKFKLTLEQLYTTYINKIYNGMKIIDVYKGGNNHTLCTVQCQQDKSHIYKNKELGIVINNRFYCPKCTDNGTRDVGQILRIRGLFRLACRRFQGIRGIGTVSYGYNSSNENVGLTAKEFYDLSIEQGGSICKYCREYAKCTQKNQTKMNITYISTQADLLDTINEAKQDVASRCPSVYSQMGIEGASISDIDIPRELIMFRDAYRGRDKLVYRFCKCIKHGTEMLLSETEIIDFDHQRCMESDRDVVRFFDIGNEVLLGNKK